MRGAVTRERVLLWALRAAWAALPLLAGPAFAEAFAGRARAVQVTGSVGLWAVWAAVLLATLVPLPLTLTIVRLVVPAAWVAALAAVASTSGHTSLPAAAGAVLTTTLLVLLALLPEVARPFVNGSAYPNERRFPLRVPGPLLLGPLPLAWALTVAPVPIAILLLAAEVWVPGGILLVAGAALAYFLGRALHGLSRRWLVFVPAGLVLHDPSSLVDPVLFERRVVESVHPAPAGSDSLDLTQRSMGLALELVLKEKVPMVRVTPGHHMGEAGSSARLLFTPTRPGAVLAEAAARRLSAVTPSR